MPPSGVAFIPKNVLFHKKPPRVGKIVSSIEPWIAAFARSAGARKTKRILVEQKLEIVLASRHPKHALNIHEIAQCIVGATIHHHNQLDLIEIRVLDDGFNAGFEQVIAMVVRRYYNAVLHGFYKPPLECPSGDTAQERVS